MSLVNIIEEIEDLEEINFNQLVKKETAVLAVFFDSIDFREDWFELGINPDNQTIDT